MPVITSQHNPRLKELRKLRRRHERERSGRFLAEGEDLIAAAIVAGRPAVEGFRVAGSAIGGPDFEDVEQGVLLSVSTLGSGTRAIGVYKQRFAKPTGPLCVYLHGVGDPGNVGAVLRSALAFGADCVALGPGCADPHSPKAVRASMGAIFAVGLAHVSEVSELPGKRIALVAGAGMPIWSLREGICRARGEVAGAGRPIWGVREGAGEARGDSASVPENISNAMPPAHAGGTVPGKPQTSALTLLVGAERDGLPEDVVEACDSVAHIPISSESLNAAMAATVALYEMTRPSTRVPAS